MVGDTSKWVPTVGFVDECGVEKLNAVLCDPQRPYKEIVHDMQGQIEQELYADSFAPLRPPDEIYKRPTAAYASATTM